MYSLEPMGLQKILANIFNELSESLVRETGRRSEQGGLALAPADIRIVGQCALLLADLPFPVAGSVDLDALIRGDFWVRSTLEKLLLPEGLTLDSDAHLIWMPDDTRYTPFFASPVLTVTLAEPDAVIASKCKFRRPKDRDLIRTYLQHFPGAQESLKRWKISWQWITS